MEEVTLVEDLGRFANGVTAARRVTPSAVTHSLLDSHMARPFCWRYRTDGAEHPYAQVQKLKRLMV